VKKLVPLGLVLVLLLAATSVVSADPPPGVAPVLRIDAYGECGFYFPDAAYQGDGVKQFSNGATGHTTWKCQLELLSGTPKYIYFEFSVESCDHTVSVEGNKGMWTIQCFGEWAAP